MDFKRLTKEECAERLMALEAPVAVLMHRRPDGDAVGSATALVYVLRELGIRATAISADPVSERLAFLTEGVEKIELCECKSQIAIDVASPPQLGSLLGRVSPALMIDHHAVGEAFCDFYTVPDASSAAEVLLDVTDVLISLGKMKMSAEIAKRAYAAMSSDTGGFIYSNATAKTHRRVAELLGCGIDAADINHRLFNSKSEAEIRAEGEVSRSIKVALGGTLAYATLTKKRRDELSLTEENFECAIDVVRALRGARVALFVRETDDGTLRASMRSTGVDVAKIAARFSGGGHVRAAGCSPVARDVDEAAKMIIDEIKRNYGDMLV